MATETKFKEVTCEVEGSVYTLSPIEVVMDGIERGVAGAVTSLGIDGDDVADLLDRNMLIDLANHALDVANEVVSGFVEAEREAVRQEHEARTRPDLSVVR